MTSEIFPFFTGCQRSGTTLIRTIFNAHSAIAIPGESHFIPELAARRERYEQGQRFDVGAFIADLRRHDRFRRWKIGPRRVRQALTRPKPSSLEDAIRRVYAAFAEKQGKPRYGDKTPRYATQIPLLAAMFPEARFVHVIRDGRNVALSVREMTWGPDRLEECALYWRERVTAARAAGAELGPDRYLEYRHEDLIADPEGVVRRICAFLDLPFEPSMLDYHVTKQPKAAHMQHLAKPPTPGLRDWSQQMSEFDRRVFELLAGDVLEETGYELSTSATTLSQADERKARRVAQRTRREAVVKRSPAVQRLSGTRLGRALVSAYDRSVGRYAK